MCHNHVNQDSFFWKTFVVAKKTLSYIRGEAGI